MVESITIESSLKAIAGYLDTSQAIAGPVASTCQGLEAILVPRGGHPGNYYYHYDVILDGEVIVANAWEPQLEAARVLHNRGISGSLTFLDHKTLKPRLILDISKAAKLTVTENTREGPKFRKWRPYGLGK